MRAKWTFSFDVPDPPLTKREAQQVRAAARGALVDVLLRRHLARRRVSAVTPPLTGVTKGL